MIVKALGLLAPLAAGAVYFSGAFDAGYAREVAHSPDQVFAALDDLDIRKQPGEPGTDPSRSGGVAPEFRTERTAEGISFVVMSGDQVATRMIARIEPIDGGARTRVTAKVERGDAPDERTSPAFRSVGITMGLFVSAISDELNELETPPTRSAEACRELEQDMNNGEMHSGVGAIVRVHEMEAEMRRNGCSTRGGGAFRRVEQHMAPASPSTGGWGNAPGPSQPEQGGWGGSGGSHRRRT